MKLLRGRYKKSEVSRQQVLDAAIRVLAKRGFARTSVGHIAVAAGMSKGAVHYHFSHKDDLIVAVLERCVEITDERVRGAWESAGSPTEKIHKALQEMRERWRQGGPELRVLADLMAQGMHDEKLKAPVSKLFARTRTQLVSQLVGSLEQLGLRPRIPAHIVPRLLLATLDGLAVHDFFDPTPEEDVEQLLHAVELIAFSLFEL